MPQKTTPIRAKSLIICEKQWSQRNSSLRPLVWSLVNGEKSLEEGGSECGVFFENSHEITNVIATDKCGGLLDGMACGERLFCFRYLCGKEVVFRISSGVLFEGTAEVCFAKGAAFSQLTDR